MEQLLARPRYHRGKLHWLLPCDGVDSGLPKDAFILPHPLAKIRPMDLVYGFANERQATQQKLYVILYVRVSSNGQAKKGGSLQSQLRTQLEKCAIADLSVAGIAIDVASAMQYSRPALDQVEAALHRGRAHAMVVANLSRADRVEANGVLRFSKQGAWDAWTYFASEYDDPYFRVAAWPVFETRGEATRQLRRWEEEQTARRIAASETELAKLADGFLVATQKVDSFFLYEIEILDEQQPLAKRRFVQREDAIERFEWLETQIGQAYTSNDSKLLSEVAEEASTIAGKTITPDDFWWELALGIVVGENCRSPNSAAAVYVDCPSLAISGISRDRWESLVDQLDSLLSQRPKRNLNPILRSNDLTDLQKAQLAEKQANDGTAIRWRLTCCCGDSLTEVEAIGMADDIGPGQPQDFMECPKCHNRSIGMKGKVRYPHKKEYEWLDRTPTEPCLNCGCWVNLEHAFDTSMGALTWSVFLCNDCAGALTAKKLLTVVPPPPEAPPKQGMRDAPPSTAIGLKEELAAQKPDPESAPPGVELPLWPHEEPDQENAFERNEPADVAGRLLPVLTEHGRSHCFTATQLHRHAFGRRLVPSDRLFKKNWKLARKALQGLLQKEGLRLAAKKYPARPLYAFWVEPLEGANPS